MFPLILLLAFAGTISEDLPAGRIVDDVRCVADPSQSYSLFLPSNYTPARTWPVIFAFDPGGRGRNPVERYQAAAEQYGYIIAGSNNSRNGSAETGKAVAAMTSDVTSRFRIDTKLMYTAGMSGGARVALGVALGSPNIAGVIASSAGYPDGRSRKTLPFPVFATAGTEDFNHLEMRELDRELTSPHRLAIFEGGHVWLSSALAIEAVEWMELQAMKAGRKSRDEFWIDQTFSRRVAAAGKGKADKDTFLALQAIAEDFDRLKDVSALAAKAAELGRDKNIREALKRDRDEDDREARMLAEVRSAEDRLTSFDDKPSALSELRMRWRKLSDQAKQPGDSSDRRLARRVLSGLAAGRSTTDPEYLKIIREYQIGRGGR